MREEEELTEEARRSREQTRELREESGLGDHAESDSEPNVPRTPEGEPRAKTSSGDADSVTEDD
jgi:hypothetical protein